jgi:SAM-dependent methyltransferase
MSLRTPQDATREPQGLQDCRGRRSHVEYRAPWYFSVGESGLKACINAASQSYLSSVRRILDIPCGHGRVARYLRAGFPNAEMFFCEIDKSAADFCPREFGGTAVYSRPELTEIDIPGDLDLIWIGSSPTSMKTAPAAGSGTWHLGWLQMVFLWPLSMVFLRSPNRISDR